MTPNLTLLFPLPDGSIHTMSWEVPEGVARSINRLLGPPLSESLFAADMEEVLQSSPEVQSRVLIHLEKD